MGATLPLAGRTVLERQARLAASAGAASVVILIERLPAELAAAIDRMRSEGISPVVARSVDEAAEAVQAVDRVLLMGDGVVADPAQVLRLVKAGDAAVLTVGEADRIPAIYTDPTKSPLTAKVEAKDNVIDFDLKRDAGPPPIKGAMRRPGPLGNTFAGIGWSLVPTD